MKTFSIGFPVAEYDETSYAREVAKHLGTEHHEERVEPDCIAILPKLDVALRRAVRRQFGDSDLLRVANDAREHVTVALSGDGGDELFAGYPRYQAVRLASMFDRLPAAVRRVLTGAVMAAIAGQPSPEVAGAEVQAFRRQGWTSPASGGTSTGCRSSTKRNEPDLYSDDFLAQLPDTDPFEFLHAAFGRVPQARPGDRSQPGGSGYLSAVRSDDQGRHRLDGARAGVPGPVSRSARCGTGGPMPVSLKFRGDAASGYCSRRSASCCRRSC